LSFAAAVCCCRASTFAYLRENHNSVLGIREYAMEAGGTFKAVNETFVEHWVADEECGANLLQLEGPDGNVRQLEGEDGMIHNLFAFPAEDNFAGWWREAGRQ
jgi:molybdenum cofactor sulfurtransferase